MLGYHLVLVTLHWGLQLVLIKTIRFGDTKYDIWCTTPILVNWECSNFSSA
jgi:hypothetical protein